MTKKKPKRRKPPKASPRTQRIGDRLKGKVIGDRIGPAIIKKESARPEGRAIAPLTRARLNNLRQGFLNSFYRRLEG